MKPDRVPAARDVTVQKQASQYARSLIEASLDPLVTISAEGKVTDVNEATVRVTGVDRDGLVGTVFSDYFTEPDRARAGYQQVFAEGSVTDYPLTIRHVDGSVTDVLYNASVYRDTEGNVLGVFAAARDVTAQNQAKAEVMRANAAKSEFLSRMSHELRTPLNAILGFGQLLDMHDLTAEERDEVEHIIAAGEHLLGLIDEVLDITRVESGALPLSLEPVCVSDVLDEAVGMLHPIADRRWIRIVVDAQASRVHVQASRQRLKQVIVNLLSNAVKYNVEGGEVRVTIEDLGNGRVRITVSDTGIGIADDDLGRLFQPFERLSAAASHVQGTGLGLALSRHLVSAMAGEIGVTSRVGEGSSFWVELPTAQGVSTDRTETVRRREELPPVAGGPKTLLYIEDNPSNVHLLERVVGRRPDVTLMVAMLGRLGLELAWEHRPDLILLDLHLPDVSGEEVLAALKADPRTAATPVVVLSADATPGTPGRLLANGAADYLTKPLDVRRLLAVIDSLGTTPRPATTDLDPTSNTTMVAATPGPADENDAAGLLGFVHDFNNLLGVILTYCAILASDLTDPAEVSDLGEIHRAAEAAVALTGQLVTYRAHQNTESTPPPVNDSHAVGE